MKNQIRGIECTANRWVLEQLVQYWGNDEFHFWISSCMIYPDLFSKGQPKNLELSYGELDNLVRQNIWELDFKVFDKNSEPEHIMSYDDFLRSGCIFCLLYYDCQFLELYIKRADDYERIRKLLECLGSENLITKTDSSDGREYLHL